MKLLLDTHAWLSLASPFAVEGSRQKKPPPGGGGFF